MDILEKHLGAIKNWSIVLIIFGLLMQISFVFVQEEMLPHSPFEEDTFFHMAVTRNIAMGNGITIDGKTPSSGAQPGNYIYTIAHVLGKADKFDSLRWARVIGIFGSMLSAALVFYNAKYVFRFLSTRACSTVALLSAALWIVSFQVYRVNLNGYETVYAACALLFVSLLFFKLWDYSLTSSYPKWIHFAMGLGCALAVYARIDSGLFIAILSLSYLFFAGGNWLKRVVHVSIWATVAVILTLPFWVNNLKVGGSLMPISGKASSFQMSIYGFETSVINCIAKGWQSLAEIPIIGLYMPFKLSGSFPVILMTTLASALVIWMLYRDRDVKKIWNELSWKPWAVVIGGLIALFSYYVFFHGSSWFMKRYMHPFRAEAYIFSGLYLFSIVMLVRRFVPIRIGLHLTCALVLLASFGQWFLLYNKKETNVFYEVSQAINEKYAGEKVGAFQSGTLGYFCDNVSNLDGKNNPESLNAVIENRVVEHILAENYTIITDWPVHIPKYCNMELFNKHFELVEMVGTSGIYKRKSTPAGL